MYFSADCFLRKVRTLPGRSLKHQRHTIQPEMSGIIFDTTPQHLSPCKFYFSLSFSFFLAKKKKKNHPLCLYFHSLYAHNFFSLRQDSQKRPLLSKKKKYMPLFTFSFIHHHYEILNNKYF